MYHPAVFSLMGCTHPSPPEHFLLTREEQSLSFLPFSVQSRGLLLSSSLALPLWLHLFCIVYQHEVTLGVCWEQGSEFHPQATLSQSYVIAVL